jgi:O-antigen/teichoic acid export membrane protein
VISSETDTPNPIPSEIGMTDQDSDSDQSQLYSLLTIVKNVFSLILSTLVAMGLGFVISWILARKLGDELYGNYVFMLGIAGLIVSLADLGLGRVTIREMAKEKGKAGEYLFTGIIIRLAAYVLVFLVIVGLAFSIEQLNGWEMTAIVIGLTAIILNMSNLLRGPFTSFEKLELDLLTRGAEQGVSLVIVIGLIALGLSLNPLTVGLLVGATAGLVITIYYTLKLTPPSGLIYNTETGKSLLKTGIPMGFSIIIVGFYARYDVLILGILRDTQEVAWFSIAYSFILILALISFSSTNALFPIFSRLSGIHREQQLTLLRDSLRYVLIIAIAVSGGVYITAETVVLTIYGQEYAPAFEALQIMAFSLTFMFPTHLMLTLLYAENRQNWVLSGHFTSGVLLLIFDPLLISRYGIHGAALSNIMVEFTIFCVYIYFTKISIGSIGVDTIVRPMLAGIIAAGVYLVLPLPLILSIMMCGSVYLAALFAVQAIRPKDVSLIKGLVYERFNLGG